MKKSKTKRRAKKLYNYRANSVYLSEVPREHRGSNLCCQYSVLIRSTSIKAVADLLGPSCSARHLSDFCGITRLESERDSDRVAIIKKDNTFYYSPGHTCIGHISDWLEYKQDFSNTIIWSDHDRDRLRRMSNTKKLRFHDRPDEIALSPAQLEALRIIWMRYGNNGWAHTDGGHKFIQGLLEHGQDWRDLFKPEDVVLQKVDLILNDKFI